MPKPPKLEYTLLTGKTKTEVGDEYNPWRQGFRRLPPPYGYPVSDFPGAVYRRPVLSAKVKQELRNLL